MSVLHRTRATEHANEITRPPHGIIRTHLAYLIDADPTFRYWWNGINDRARVATLRRLCELNDIASRMFILDIPWPEVQRHVDARLALMMVTCPNHDELPPMDSREWIKAARTRRHNRDVCELAAARVRSCLASRGVPARVYGGLKSAASILSKIAAVERGQTLDLWDALRLRIVAASIDDVGKIAALLTREFGTAVWRCRNYYTHPRSGADLYRAIHLVVAVVDRVMEIQIMSARREVVCECDHSIVFKKTVPPVTPFHVEWLRQLSRAANLGDALSDIQDDGHPKKI
jgi:hypothetical protein